ncbi:hypothetical protein Tco_0730580 [Tanacetum coccineum]|uniref:Reverse transcriptase domain-containing protein n=1 Tax=Tanacetum coccineum TaxID=301880 RepID=A0ABQ4YS97_9ASTR
MADQRTMAELLQAPTEGYGDAIVIPTILAENFELKHDYSMRLLRACPIHDLRSCINLILLQCFTPTDQDSLNAAADGNLLTKTPRDALTIIENKSKVRNSRNKPIVSKVSTNAPSSSTPHSPEIAALVDAVKAMLHQKSSPPASVKAVWKFVLLVVDRILTHQMSCHDEMFFQNFFEKIFKDYVCSQPQ